MKIFLIILLARTVYSATVSGRFNGEPFDISEGIVTHRGGRIVYGVAASDGQFKHFVLIYVTRPTKLIQCGAGLISPLWVLTARHCVEDAVSIELRFGLTHRDRYEQRLYTTEVVRNRDVDIALIKLKISVQLTALVKPALLPRLSQVRELFGNQKATVCGFGIEKPSTGEISTYLQYAELNIMIQSYCRPYFGDVDIRIMCAKSTNSLASACSGDSGSPLIVREDNDQVVIVGVVSFGAGSGCDRGYPVGYVRTTHQLDWIAYTTGIVLRN